MPEEPGCVIEVQDALRKQSHQARTSKVRSNCIVGENEFAQMSMHPVQRSVEVNETDAL